jgi:hypothetical protein
MKPSIMIVTPCRGNFGVEYVQSMNAIVRELTVAGIGYEWRAEMDKPTGYARNTLVAAFLRSKHTHALWLDADNGIPPGTLQAMVATGKDFVTVPYVLRPRKHDLDGGQVQKALKEYSVVLSDLDQEPRNGAVRVTAAGFGCVLTSRACLERLVAAHPELEYRGPKQQRTWALFAEMVADGGYHLEDHAFSMRWRGIGGEIWAMLDCVAYHAELEGRFGREIWAHRDELRELHAQLAQMGYPAHRGPPDAVRASLARRPVHVEADVLIVNAIGPAFTGDSVRLDGIGGSELEITQIAEALAARGHKVVVANGVHETAESHGVQYVPLSLVAGGKVRALYIERMTARPDGIDAARVVVRATDMPSSAYDRHAVALHGGEMALVCVSEAQAKAFGAFGQKGRCVIPPILGDLPDVPKIAGRFVYASAPGKGLAETLATWRRLKEAHTDELASASLTIVCPGGYDYLPTIAAADRALSVHLVGAPSPEAYRRTIAESVGIFYVSDRFVETFGCFAALAERAGCRVHVLARAGLGGLPEAVTNTRLLTTEPAAFERDFLDAWRRPDSPEWYASTEPRDLSAATLAVEWERVLRLPSASTACACGSGRTFGECHGARDAA